jgi:hypothetical protein
MHVTRNALRGFTTTKAIRFGERSMCHARDFNGMRCVDECENDPIHHDQQINDRENLRRLIDLTRANADTHTHTHTPLYRPALVALIATAKLFYSSPSLTKRLGFYVCRQVALVSTLITVFVAGAMIARAFTAQV